MMDNDPNLVICHAVQALGVRGFEIQRINFGIS